MPPPGRAEQVIIFRTQTPDALYPSVHPSRARKMQNSLYGDITRSMDRVFLIIVIVTLIIFVIILEAVIGALKSLSVNSISPQPAGQSDAREQPPCESFSLRLYVC